MIPSKAQAIQTALHGDWTNAILLNLELLKEDPSDIDTLNRLAFAYASTGDIPKAKELYTTVLQLDVQNPIATKNLRRLSNNSEHKLPTSSPIIMNNIFIEESGKTKVIELLNIADKKILMNLYSGEHLTLSVKRSKIFVLDSSNQYLGMLPDDISKRLIEFIAGGNTYDAYIKTVSSSRVVVFVRETKRSKKFMDQPSFAQSEKTKLVVEEATKKSDTKPSRSKRS